MDRWSQLSMSEKSDLMSLYIKNGISSLEEIKKHYNSFPDGGPLNREQYIQQQRDSLINQAYQRSLIRTTPEAIKPMFVPYSKGKLENLQEQIKAYWGQVTNPEVSLEARQMWADKIVEAKKLIEAGGEFEQSPSNCIYTALSNYGAPYRVTGNQTFYANPGKYGFERIPIEDVRQGDVVQYTARNGTPIHAAIYNTTEGNKVIVNYSNGDDVYRTNAYYGSNPTYAYRFIGTQADLDRWNKEYNEKYGNSFATDGHLYPDGGTLGKIKSYFAPTYEGTYEQAYTAAKRNNNEYFKWQGNRYKVEDSPEKRQPTESTPDYSSMSFGKAYRQASKDLGVGEEFGWNGNVYLANEGKEESTNLEDLPVYKVWEQVTGKPWSVAKQYGLTDGRTKTNLGLKKALIKYNKAGYDDAENSFSSAHNTMIALADASSEVNDKLSFNVPEDEKGIKILDRNAKKNFGTIIYPTVLDTLAVHGFNTKTNPTITFGLPAQESALSPYRDKGAYERSSYNNPDAARNILSAWDMNLTPITGTLNAIDSNYRNNLEQGIRYGAPYGFRKYADYEEPTNVIDWAYDYFKRGKYNQGDHNHTMDVINRGKTLINSREMQDWFYNHWLPQVGNQDEWIQWWNNGKPRSIDSANQLEMLSNYAAGGHLYQDGGPIKKESNYSVGRVLDGIYRAVNHEEFMGEPSHKYQFIKPEYVGLSEEELDSLVGQADERGHRLDVVKAEAHPSHYSRGAWSGNDFELTDKGLAEVNHTYFGLNDGGQDPQARLTYKGSTVLPEITVTPDGAYIYNTYDNIKLHLKQQGGPLGKVTPYGQWQYPHQITTIPSNNITMKGVDYPVIGVSNTGDTKYMLPNMDYLFEGQYVTEYPVHKFQEGGPDDDRYSFLRREPEIAVADNTRYVKPITDVEIDRASGLPEGTTTMRRIISAQADRQQPVIKQDNVTNETHKSINKEVKKAQNAKKVNDVANTVAAVTSIPATIVAPEVMTPIFALQGFNDATDVLSKEGNLNTEDYGRLGLDALFMLPMFNTAGNYLRFNTNLGRSYELSRALNKSIRNTELSQRSIENPANNRFRLGDVEINDPNLMYRQTDGRALGEVASGGNRHTMFNRGSLWYGIPTESMLNPVIEPKTVGKLKLTKPNSEVAKTHLLVTRNADMTGANQKFGRVSIGPHSESSLHLNIEKSPEDRWLNEMIREWRNKNSEPGIATYVTDGGSRRVPLEGALNNSNTSIYTFDSNYGYRRIQEPIPTLEQAYQEGNFVSQFTNPSQTLVLSQSTGVYPQIKPLVQGAEIEKQLSKAGTISRKSLDAYISKQSKYYQEVMNETLEADFKGVDKIDYTAFKDAVQKRLPEYNRVSQTDFQDYGLDKLGYSPYEFMDGFGNPLESSNLKTFTFESPNMTGNNKHYSGNPIGHSRTYTTKEEPNVLHVMESQSDWAQNSRKIDSIKRGKTQERIDKLEKQLEEWEEALKSGINPDKTPMEPWAKSQIEQEFIPDLKRRIQEHKSTLSDNTQKSQHMIDTYTERQIQENLKYAAEQGQTKMRYPTRETAAKIEGYKKQPAKAEVLKLRRLQDEFIEKYGYESKEIEEKIQSLINTSDYAPEHQTILKKYDAFPRQFQKLFGKKAEVRTVTDSKGNTWYEVDVPESYRNKTGQIIFSLGGLLGTEALIDK